jgi:hypothetical protein
MELHLYNFLRIPCASFELVLSFGFARVLVMTVISGVVVERSSGSAGGGMVARSIRRALVQFVNESVPLDDPQTT